MFRGPQTGWKKHFWAIIRSHNVMDRKRLQLSQAVSVCSLKIGGKKTLQIGTGLLSFSASLHESGVFLFLNTLCNLDKHMPLVNHGSNCTGRYVTVNMTCNSQKSWPCPYRDIMRHSLTLERFITQRLVGVLCLDSQYSCRVQTVMDPLIKSLEILILRDG